jgi:hypothetical protein
MLLAMRRFAHLTSIIPSFPLPLLAWLTPIITLPLLRAWGGRLFCPTHALNAFERGKLVKPFQCLQQRKGVDGLDYSRRGVRWVLITSISTVETGGLMRVRPFGAKIGCLPS